MVQEVHQVKEIESALKLLYHHQHNSKILAGGTDLIIQLREKKITPRVLIDISSIQETKEIKIVENSIEIGSTATFSAIEQHPYMMEKLSPITKAAKSIGSPQIRNRATVGGNICNASPAADMLPPLLVMDAMVVLNSAHQTRVLPLSEFITGKEETLLNTDEMMEKIRFQKMPDSAGLGFSKLGIRNALAIARLSMAVYIEWDQEGKCEHVRIASGALGLKAQREWECEAFMQGKPLNDHIVEETALFLEQHTAKRLAGRSTMPFKRHAVKGVFKEAMREVMRTLKGENPYENSTF